MRQRKWQALGGMLKTLRESRDIPQKEVIARLTNEMTDRTLRAYEAGHERPSRERLLRILVTGLAVHNAAEANECLGAARYVPLDRAEVEQHGMTSDALSARGLQTGPPADFRAEAATLIATDGQGREVWRHQFPTRFAQGVYDNRDAIRRCTFADVDADGAVETLFVYVPLDFGSVGATLFCFDEDGKVRWTFEPGKVIRDTRQEYRPPYFISNVQIIPMPDARPRILVSSNHYLHNPNQIAMLDVRGALISEYWHSGHLLSITHADLNGDGVGEILLGGVNNGYRQATMVVFDPRNVQGASTQPDRQILGFPPGTEKAVVLFPRTCLSKNSPYNRVHSLWITKERRIVLPIVEGVSEARNPGVMIYELDFNLNVISARPDSHLQEAHRLLEIEGALDHSWTEAENERLRSQVIVKGSL
jgi:transcriptional regulator with XRE-family HTH domain